VLAPKFGGFLTFAAVEEGAGTAPGQPTIHELRDLYRFHEIDRSTKVFGIVGWPVTHSRGPQVHNAGFAAIGFNGVYLPLPIMPEWEQFKATMLALIEDPRLDFAGCSVTLPHKEHLLRLVREEGGEVDPLAEEIGAANTLLVAGDRSLRCVNTDAPAAVEALGECENRKVVVLGAGGVARAVVAGLVSAGAEVVVVNRTRARAEALAEAIGGVTVGSMDDLADADTFINCTSVGMEGGPDPEGLPLPDDVPLDDTKTVFDTVYTPERTPLIARAEAAGARVVLGTAMFRLQAALQFELWTGKALPS
jgi:3-dehydroquinate dehydratase/shikimate dehydrogenase